ncbi:type II toxin-antitoxin system prevent-host-death family antitoxin [Paramagnetospirillum kuznetsovii]|uniref:Antitoxin n=1 Tax=Paramagnetospirillum kuznetsovii TaxID=2053833 RepID=A0A364NXD4_9PROT|nr:type II toxin-antitoxin system prevent-host-death family antitoxin [Paramagnetospirillum kuznetsovii]RAU21759.1 type II toxin-antitoxin system prevent-host-death family antitoxin [Paramagnetospirillum kuznetsovii]
MHIVKAGEFKAKCLQLMDEVAQTGESVIITKNGVPVARLAPLSSKPDSLFGIMKDSIHVHGDIMSPTAEAWEVMA